MNISGCTRVEGDNVTVSENDTVSGGEGTSSRNRREIQDYVSYFLYCFLDGGIHLHHFTAVT